MDERMKKTLEAYERYGKKVEFKNHLGRPMPRFNELPPTIQAAWVEAVNDPNAPEDVATVVREERMLSRINQTVNNWLLLSDTDPEPGDTKSLPTDSEVNAAVAFAFSVEAAIQRFLKSTKK